MNTFDPTKMKNLFALLATVSALAFLPSVVAIPITGQLVMDGSVSLNNSSLADATEVTSFGTDVLAGGASDGVFTAAGEAGASVTLNGFSFNTTPFTAVTPFWTVVSGDDTFSFSLTGLQILVQDSLNLNILGTGVITSDNPSYSATGGTFSLTISDSNGTGDGTGTFEFGFQAESTATASVPDGGVTASLLGLGFLGLIAFKRRA